MRSPLTSLVLDIVIVVSAALVLLIALTGGVDYEWGVLRVRAHVVWRPLLVLAAALGVRLRLFRITTEQAVARGFLALILAVAATYGQHHVRACGGLDSYGYVGASRLIASGRLEEEQPLARLLPFPDAARAAAPLGWVVGSDGQSRVPRFPLGLPLVMAVFQIFGPEGPLFVPLVLAFATLAIVYLAGRDAASPTAGLFAATIVAVNPVFFDLAIQPMSDVPATFWLVVAAWLLLLRRRWPIVAGIGAGMAVLTRPVLLPAIVMMLALAMTGSRRNSAPFAAVVTVFVLIQLALNAALYGSPLASGYGDSSHLFETGRLGTNLATYAKWITYVHTPAFWPAWIAGLFALRRHPWGWQFSAVAVAVALPYLFYILYDDWEALRFILPGIVLAIVVAAVGFHALLASWLRPAVRSIALFGIAVTCAYASHAYLERHRVFDLKRAEAKYPMLGRWLAGHTPERAVILSALHSGSIRYYGARETVRWDEMPAGTLGETVRRLRGQGYATFVALDVPSEAEPFNARFRDELDRVQMLPAGRVREVNVWELR
jgi:hypothetical protein